MGSSYSVTYNGVTIQSSVIRQFDSVAFYNTDKTQKLYNEITLGVTGYVNPILNPGMLSDADYITQLRSTLEEPRGYLQVVVDGDVLIQQNGLDAANGPLPQAVAIIPPCMGSTIQISFTIKTFIAECITGTPDPVLSNRWTQTQSIDSTGLSTIRSEGTLTIRSDASVSPDSYRDQIFPIKSIGDGDVNWTRESQEYVLSSDNLSLNWRIVDQEVYRAPTNGITKWAGKWHENSTYENPGWVNGTLEATAWGNTKMSKPAMASFLLSILASRFNYQTDWLKTVDWEEGLSENSLSLKAFFIVNAGNTKAGNSSGPVWSTRIGAVIPITDQNSQQTYIGDRSTYGIMLYTNNLFSTCASKVGYISLNPATDQVPQSVGSNNPISSQPVSSGGSPDYSQPQQTNPYIESTITTSIEEDHQIFQLPNGNGGGTSGSQGNPSSIQPAALVAVGSPTTVMKVRYSFARIGAAPQLPQVVNTSNQSLKNRIFRTPDPTFMADGTNKIYYCDGEDTYVLVNTAQLGSGSTTIYMPSSPIDQSGLSQSDSNMAVTSQNYISGIINAPLVPGGSGN